MYGEYYEEWDETIQELWDELVESLEGEYDESAVEYFLEETEELFHFGWVESGADCEDYREDFAEWYETLTGNSFDDMFDWDDWRDWYDGGG